MEVTLYRIKDELPAAVVSDLPKLLDNINTIKCYFDFKAFIQIEFESARAMKAARTYGFPYDHEGQPCSIRFASITRVMAYVQDKFVENIGNGF